MALTKFPENKSVRITKLAFSNRLTEAEEIAIDLASIGATVEAAAVRRFIKKIDLAEHVDLSRQDTIDGLNQLESFGLIGSGRASEILSAPLQEHEHFRG